MAKKRSEGANPAVKRCIDYYHDEFLKRHGIKPLLNGGHAGQLFTSMFASQWSEADVQRVVHDFVWGNDPWAVKCGWTIGALQIVAQRLMTGGAAPADDRTASNVDAAMRATRRR